MSQAKRTDKKDQKRGVRALTVRAGNFLRSRTAVRSALKIGVVVLALALALFPFPSAFVERFYSNGFYPLLQSVFTPVSNIFPFAVTDLLIAALLLGLPLWWIIRIKRAGRGRRLRETGSLLFNTLVLTAAAFLIFEILWGFNYQRQPLMAKLEYDKERLTSDALYRLTDLTRGRLNIESPEAHAQNWPTDDQLRRLLSPSFDSVVKDLGNRRSIAPASAKTSLLNVYFKATGIEGVTNPFGHEVIINSELLPFERPFILAHEWGHLAGFADESEANFVALLACVRSESASIRYAGWLALYQYLPRQSGEHAEPLPDLAPEVIADLRAIRERMRKGISESISRMQAKVYDQFLKANRVPGGINNYGLLVGLMIGTRFEPDWVPVRRTYN